MKIIAKYKPAVFVMENVKGMLSAKVNGKLIFNEILEDLRHPKNALEDSKVTSGLRNDIGYKIYSLVVAKEDGEKLSPRDYIIKSEDYGIGQARHRVILLGIRTDINIKPRTLTPSKDKVTVKNLIGTYPRLGALSLVLPAMQRNGTTSLKALVAKNGTKNINLPLRMAYR